MENEVSEIRQHTGASCNTNDETVSQRLLLLSTQLRARVSLMLLQKLRVQLDIPWLIHTVYVPERSCNAKVGADLDQRIVDIVDVLWLGVQRGIVDVRVVHTVLFSTRDTDLHLEPDSEGSHSLEVFDARLDVLLLRFLGQIEHVRGKKGFLVCLVILLVSSEHAIEPRQEFLRAMVAVKHDGTTNGNAS